MSLFNHAKVVELRAIPGYKISPSPLCNKNMPSGKVVFGERSEAETHIVFVHTATTDEEEVSIGRYECVTRIKDKWPPVLAVASLRHDENGWPNGSSYFERRRPSGAGRTERSRSGSLRKAG